MLTTQVDNFPTRPGIMGPDLMQKMRDHAVSFGAEFVQKNVESVDISKSPFQITVDGSLITSRSVIVATGAQTLWLDVPGISKLIGRGVSSCAPCDAPFFKGKKVAVVGGGDSAMEEASVLTKYASEVTIIHRREEFRASKAMQEKVLHDPKIKILWNTEVAEVVGEDRVMSLKVKNNKTNEISDLPIDGVFVAIGHKPNSDIFKGLIETDEEGFIKNHFDKYHTATSVPGVFVCGDVFDSQYKQAVTSAGSGCMAGMDALKYLEGTSK